MEDEEALQPRSIGRSRRIRHLTLDALIELETKPAPEILLRLASDGGGLLQFVQNLAMGEDKLILLLRIFHKCFTPDNLQACHEHIRTIIDIVLQNDFLNFTVLDFLMKRNREDENLIVAATMVLVHFALIISPNVAYPKVFMFPLRLQEKLRDIPDTMLVQQLAKINEDIEKHKPAIHKDRGYQGSQFHHGAVRMREDEDHAMENFRELPLFPTPEDLTAEQEIFVRRQRDSGRYNSLEEYLDIQFRLFRADSIIPLRESIEKYLGNHNAEGVRESGHGVRVYRDVQIIRPVCTNTELAYRIAFDISYFAAVDWRTTQRLKYGSLLCLSSDNFQTYLCATVKEHDASLLSNGLVDVVFILEREELYRVTEIGRDQRFIMVESPAYFEAYRHVLQGLKKLNDHNFPFIRYIVECQKVVTPPLYLQNRKVQYDFRPLLDENFKIRDEKDRIAAALVDLGLEDNAEVDVNEVVQIMAEGNVEVMSKRDWPAAEDLNLDETQYEAMHNVLTREFALVQGPPGTGKTYLGLKILKMLLHNSHAWNDPGQKRPMLIVCYTNHALDQFLEGVLDFFQGSLVRVGGRSSSDRLADMNLTNYRKRAKANRKIPMEVHEAKHRVRLEMQKLSIEIHQNAAWLEIVEQEIVKEDVLKDFISQHHLADLKKTLRRGEEGSAVLRWLKLESIHERLRHQAEYRLKVLPAFKDITKSKRLSTGQPSALEYELDDENDDEDEEAMYLSLSVQENTFSRKLDIDDDDDDDDDDFLFDDLDLEVEREESEVDKVRRLQRELQLENLHQREKNVALDITGFCNKAEEVTIQDLTQVKPSKEKNREVTENYHKMMLRYKRQLQAFLRSVDKMTEDESDTVKNVFELKMKDRWRLYRMWTDLYCRQMRGEVRENERQYFDKAKKYREILDQEDRSILEEQTVIGMTTTGAARYQAILQTIGPRVIVVEEAAEVFEAHVVATLSRECQHLILIGDHKQLRPSPTVYELARKGNLDVSLFERMARNGLHLDCLGYQHRMRPEISRMMTLPELYPSLKDHPVVKNMPPVKGVKGNVFYVTHPNLEERDEETKSYSNHHEAEFLAALCDYLLKQGYSADQITALTPYSGQIRLLVKEMTARRVRGVRVSSVDNYQGEENDIILLSLVRSNSDNDIGFLKFDNRICVALSRAKMGLYVIGNFEVLQNCSELLRKVVDMAAVQGIMKDQLPLACQNHPNEKHGIMAATAKDFKKAPEGGCSKRCEVRLPCGHTCAMTCHTGMGHEDMRCDMPCVRMCTACGQKCMENHACSDHKFCMQWTEKTIPRCQHVQLLPCGQDPSEAECQKACHHVLPCGHHCQKKCGERCTQQCTVKVRVDGAPCGHSYEVGCAEKDTAPCTHPCGQELVCGHLCMGTCGTCRSGRLHAPCAQRCRKVLVCGHDCRASCCQCPPCPQPCQNRCTHNFCPSKCGDACVPCAERCQWQCQHERCSMQCSEQCNRQRCNRPCLEKLEQCGHPCPGLCGETCPPYCPVCELMIFDDLLWGGHEKDSRYVYLEDCSHVIEVNFLDQWVDVIRNFQTDTDTNTDTSTSSGENRVSSTVGAARGEENMAEERRSRVVKFPECPKCKMPIRRNLRYGNVIKEALVEMEIIKQRCRGDLDKLAEVKERLDSVRRRVPQDIRPRVDAMFTPDEVVSEPQLATRFYQIHCAVDINQILQKVTSAASRWPDMTDTYRAVEGDLQYLLTFSLAPRVILSDQEHFDLRQEFHRLKILVHLLHCRQTITEDEIQVEPRTMRRLAATIRQLMSSTPLAENDLEEGRRLQEDLKDVVPDPYSALSDEEREEIVKAISLPTGSWYACPRGHYYVIGECGRPTQVSSCPECRAAVGGEAHALAPGNRPAPEFNNAEGPRWSVEQDEAFARRLQAQEFGIGEWADWQ